MSSTAVNAAVERIRADEPYARSVVEQGAPALGDFDLTADEQAAIVDALRLDVDHSDDEVGGFSFSFGAVPLTNLIGVGRSMGGSPASQGQAGWIESGWLGDDTGRAGQPL